MLMTKAEIRKQRQAEHAAKTTARLTSGDFRNARERSEATIQAATKRRRRFVQSRRSPIVGSAEWAETRGDDLPSYDQPGDDFDTY